MMKTSAFIRVLCLMTLLAANVNLMAGERDNIPMENQVFYSEDLNLLASSTKATKASDDHWQVTSTIKNCFDEENIGEAASLMTADGETQLSVTLSYTEDNARYEIESMEASFYFYYGSDFFHDDNKELIVDTERIVGSYSTESTAKTATVNLTAPKSFPYTNVPYYLFYTVIKVKFKNGGAASTAKRIGVSRPGVLILHGLNDSSSTFKPLKEYLVNSGQFISSQILTKDYSATNTSSFYANTHQNQVVRIGLFELSNNLLSEGIASTKYDMVGHSMGGILERLYNQEVDNLHTNKLITLNTPHFGAPLGNVAPAFFNLMNGLSYTDPVWNVLRNVADLMYNPNGGREAVADLAIGSDAINRLNSNSASRLNGIPVYAVGTFLSDIEENDYSYSEPTQMTDEAAYLFAHVFYNDVPRKRYSYLLDNVVGDGIVSLASQRGGLSDYYCSMFSDAWKGVCWSNAFHCNSPKWSVTQNEIRLLLLSEPDAGNFCMSGFGTSQQYQSMMKRAAKMNSETNYTTVFTEPKGSSFIHLDIASATNGQYSHTATVSSSDDMITTMVFAVLSDDKMIADYDKDVMNFNIYGYEGKVTFYAIGRTNYNALVVDSVKVNLSHVDGINDLHLKHNTIECTISDNRIKVRGAEGAYRITVWDISGQVLLSCKNNDSNSYPLPNSKGIIVIGIETADGLQTFKAGSNVSHSNS